MIRLPSSAGAEPAQSSLRKSRSASIPFLIVTLVLGLSVLAVRALVALGSDGVLDWDETYYASTTSTAAHGLGFYPYVLGYERIPHMGGLGYVISLYVFAYKLLGPHLSALRLVSLLVSLLAVAGLFVLTKKWYGSAAGLAAVALTPSLLIFHLSNTIRLDVFAIAFVAWALVLYSHAAERQSSIAWQVAVGFTFALGLQVHLHTAAAAFAVGLAYLVNSVRALRREPAANRLLTQPIALFAAGYAVGAVLFLTLNVLPNPHGFFRTAALARLSAADSAKELNLTAPMDSSRLARTFVSPMMIVRKEITRYRSIAADLSWWEMLLWLGALPAFVFWRAAPPAFSARVLLAGAVVGGGIVFNSPSALYSAAILPFFVPVAATFVTHGFGTNRRVGWMEVSGKSVVLLLVLTMAILPALISRAGSAAKQIGQKDQMKSPPEIVTLVKSIAAPACILAGPTDFYAEHFMAYPKFVGTRQVEVRIGSTYYDLQNDVVDYWHMKHPDIVFGVPADGLDAYLTAAEYVRIADGVWRRPTNLSAGCVVSVR
jgi:4-amino-4-deoxy-L-arabinose transferase-like glycosyltransferase